MSRRAVSRLGGTLVHVLTRDQERVISEVHLYVLSEEGQTRIGRALQQRRLPGSLDTDIEEAVISEALRFVRDGGEIGSVAGWCNHRIRARSIDLARGAIRRERALGVAVSEEGVEAVEESDEATADAAMLEEYGVDVLSDGVSAMRREILESGADPLDICGVLAVVSVLAEQATIDPDCPQPLAGATPEDAACWAGLWYAGRTECFGVGNTVGQRRARAARKMKMVLRAVIEKVGKK